MSVHWTLDEYATYLRRGQPAPISEKAFQAAVLTIARASGFLAYHTYRSTKSAEGFPDVVLAPGPQLARAGHTTLYVCELKTDTGQVTPAQAAWIEALAGCTGVVSDIWRPSSLEAINERLRRPPLA